MKDKREDFLKFMKDVNLYLKHKLGVDNIGSDYSFYKKYFYNGRKDKDFDEFHAIDAYLGWNRNVLNKDTVQWFISLAKEFYSLELEFNYFVLYLFGIKTITPAQVRFRYYYRHNVDKPFRERQKFIKNRSKIKNKEIDEHEKRKREFKEFMSGPTDNQKRYTRSYKRWSIRKGNRSMRRIVNQTLQNADPDDIPDIKTIINPWDWD